MKIAVLFVIATACAVQPMENKIAQELCTIEDQEAGLCTLRVLTRDTARSQVPANETIVSETYGVCSATACLVRIELPSLIITASCTKDEFGVVKCNAGSCVPGQFCPPPPPQ